MGSLTSSKLLDIWERGWARKPARQALMLLEAASPDTAPETLADLTIGQRDDNLLRLREQMFGSTVSSVTACPACAERLELSIQADELRATSAEELKEEITLLMDDYQVSFRLPRAGDLLELPEASSPNGASRALLERCLLSVQQEGKTRGSKRLPGVVVEAVASQMAEADPQADIRLELTCPSCGHEWQAIFDIVSFFWREIQAWAQRVLYEVHAMASAYGWSEAQILAMSPVRRQLYLEMVNG